MLKALIKKQFLEVNQFYFRNRKTGANRSKTSTILFILLMAVVLLSLSFGIYGISSLLGDEMLGYGLDWLYFTFMGLMTIVIGVFGSVFNSYAMLYLSKDNEMLLAMPIPPSKILFSRMVSVFGIGVMYSAVTWVPAVIYYLLHAKLSIAKIILPILSFISIMIFVSALTCLLGWCVAMLSIKAKGKSYVTVLFTLIFLGAYYYLYFNLMGFLTNLIENLDKLSTVMRSWGALIYLMGKGASGSIICFIGFLAISVLFILLCWFFMSKNFLRIATMSNAVSKSKNKKETVKKSSIDKALLKRELKRFTSSATYLLNGGLGVLLIIAADIVVVIKADEIKAALEMAYTFAPELKPLLPLAISLVVGLIVGMDCISAPSISLEGKNIWIIKSLPISSYKILKTKENIHMIINGIPAAISTVVLGLTFNIDVTDIIIVFALSFAYIWFIDDLGLFLGILKPNLNWTNESVPIKQSIAAFICIFGGWALLFIIGLGAYLLRNTFSVNNYMYTVVIILLVAVKLLQRWIMTEGVKRFDAL